MPFAYKPNKKLVIFDLDHTLISTNSSYCYLKTLYQIGALSVSVLLRAALLKCRYYATSMTLEKLHHVVFDRMLRGFSLESLEKHIDALVDKLLPGALYLPAYQELMAAQKRGDYIALISSSPDFLVRRFASYFGIDAWEGTAYDIDHEQRLCNISKLITGPQKKRSLQLLQERFGIPKKQVVVYTDSHDDIPLLLEAGEAVAVNPDRKLARMARLNKWRII